MNKTSIGELVHEGRDKTTTLMASSVQYNGIFVTTKFFDDTSRVLDASDDIVVTTNALSDEETQDNWGSHDETIVRYEGNLDFYMYHNINSLNLHSLEINEETWKKQLIVLVENEVQTLSKLGDMKSLVENLIQKTPRNQHEQMVSLSNLKNIKSTMGDMKSAYLNMIKDRDVATKIADEAISTSHELRVKVEYLTNDLESAKNAWGNTQNALLEVEDQLYVAKQFMEQENRERDK